MLRSGVVVFFATVAGEVQQNVLQLKRCKLSGVKSAAPAQLTARADAKRFKFQQTRCTTPILGSFAYPSSTNN